MNSIPPMIMTKKINELIIRDVNKIPVLIDKIEDSILPAITAIPVQMACPMMAPNITP